MKYETLACAPALSHALTEGGRFNVLAPGQPRMDLTDDGERNALRCHRADIHAHGAVNSGRELLCQGSQFLREAAAAATVLVVFDEINRAAVSDRYPDLTVPVVRLDELGQPGEIADPVDGGLEDFRRCYQMIAAGVTELEGLLR